MDREEIARGLMCVAAPIRDGEGRVLGAISLAFPAYIDKDRGIVREIRAVTGAAAEMTARLQGARGAGRGKPAGGAGSAARRLTKREGSMSQVWLFRATHQGQGRRRIIDAGNSGLEYLRYGRIGFDASGGTVTVATGGEEMAFVCLGGEGAIEVAGQTYRLGRHDSLYVPRDTRCRIAATGAFDLAECAAPATKAYPVQHVPFQTVLDTPGLVNRAGFPPYARTIHTLIGEANVQAARLLAGITVSEDGNWTSWPPHDHHQEKEEIYLYTDMPAPSFSLHLNYTEFREMELVTPVSEGDAVAIKRGYHYNVASPGTQTRFLWIMAAVREETDRVFTKVTVQPEFDGKFKLF